MASRIDIKQCELESLKKFALTTIQACQGLVFISSKLLTPIQLELVKKKKGRVDNFDADLSG